MYTREITQVLARWVQDGDFSIMMGQYLKSNGINASDDLGVEEVKVNKESITVKLVNKTQFNIFIQSSGKQAHPS